MKKSTIARSLPLLAAGLGLVALGLRWALYAFAADSWGLLPAWHPLEIILWLLSAAVLVGIPLAVKNCKGSNRYSDNFGPSFPAAAGHILAAAGILLTVLLNDPQMPGLVGFAWKLLGWASVPCLAAAGFARAKGKRPFFLLHITVCLFLVFHIIDPYRSWSGNPQLQDYLFALLGTMALALYAFYLSAFEVGSGRRRMLMGMGLEAIFLCLTNLAGTPYPYLYLGCVIWVFTGLCAPVPKRRPKEGEPNP